MLLAVRAAANYAAELVGVILSSRGQPIRGATANSGVVAFGIGARPRVSGV
jgi:hypothetical protein